MNAETRKLFFSFVHPSIIAVLVYCTYRPPKDTRVIVAEVDMKLLLSDLELADTHCCWYVDCQNRTSYREPLRTVCV